MCGTGGGGGHGSVDHGKELAGCLVALPSGNLIQKIALLLQAGCNILMSVDRKDMAT